MVDRVLRASQPLPERGVAAVLLRQLRENRVSSLRADDDVVEGCDHIKHGPRFELSGEAFGLGSYVVRCRASVADGVMPQTAVVRAAVAEVHERPYTGCDARSADTECGR